MRRPTPLSALFSLLKSSSAGALALATMLACSDNTSPTVGLEDGVRSIEIIVPDSLKLALSAQYSANLMASSSLSASLASPVAPAALAAACGSGSGFAGYTESKVAFAPEAVPSIVPFPVYDDGILADVPLGFNFSFHGNTYAKLNVYSNGFVTFGPAVQDRDGFYRGAVIPFSASPNNLIAFAWMDWSPQAVPGGIRYETRGAAPNRRFILQFNNVPEYHSTGKLMSQLVLAEGSNDITMYTNTMTISNSSNRWTQGIENANGTEAKYDSIKNEATGVWTTRVSKFFTGIKLTDDAIRFSLVSVKDVESPSITAPANLTKDNDPGLGSAVVAVGSPVTSDNCSPVTISSVRSDGAAIDAPYPVGITTITWTAKDASLNAASATQTVTVLDKEAPVFGPSAQSVLTVNATSPSGAVVNYDVNVTDNVKVTSLSCEPASGSVFPAGPRDVSCTASDAAGNTSSMSFSVLVVGAREQMEMLMGVVGYLPLKNGASQPLINQLRAAYNDNGNECKKMSDFIDMVSKKAASIYPEDAVMLIQSAYDIMGALGCEGVPNVKASQPGARNLRVLEIARPTF